MQYIVSLGLVHNLCAQTATVKANKIRMQPRLQTGAFALKPRRKRQKGPSPRWWKRATLTWMQTH